MPAPTTTVGYGKHAQDWSYLTPKRAIGVQSGNILDPTDLGSEFEIDTTIKRDGKPIDRACRQTLVVFVVPKSSATLDRTSAVLNLWALVDWDDQCVMPESSSSACPNVGSPSDLDAIDRWALIASVTHDNATAGNGAVAFSFPWLPAGKYKAALGAGLTGEAIIVEQHTN